MAEKIAEQPKEKEPQNKTGEQEAKEETKETGTGNIGNLLSPEAVVMLPLAIIIDSIGIIIVCFGLDDFGITDVIALTIIGPWLFSRSGNIPDAQKLKRKKPPAGPGKKLFSAGIKEIIPYLGALPWWTMMVYNELKS